MKEEPEEKPLIEIKTLKYFLEDENNVDDELPISISEFGLEVIKTEAFDLSFEHDQKVETNPSPISNATSYQRVASSPSSSSSKTPHFQKSSGGKLKCSECSFSHRLKCIMERHLRSHFPSYRCNDCNSVFWTKTRRLRHREEEHNHLLTEEDKLYRKQLIRYRISHESKTICIICGKAFFKEDRREHLRLCLEKRQKVEIDCDICGKRIRWMSDLRLHMQRTHLHLDGSVVASDGPFQCHCGKTHKSKEKLKRHVAVQHKKRDLKTCDQCGKVVSNTSMLREHMRVFHTEGGQNNYMCKECGKLFNFKATLVAHEKQVHGEKIFKCQHEGCDKKFTIASFRNSHYRAAHVVDRRFQCPKCPKAFTTKTRLSRHVRVMHDKLTDKCPVDTCNYRTGRRDNMRTHLKRHFELSVEESNRCMKQLNHMNFV